MDIETVFAEIHNHVDAAFADDRQNHPPDRNEISAAARAVAAAHDLAETPEEVRLVRKYDAAVSELYSAAIVERQPTRGVYLLGQADRLAADLDYADELGVGRTF